jgi:AcrR family transcriptional regulator
MDIRDKLLDAAVRVYTKTGYRGATTRRIANEAGVNEITLFRHFGSKDALMGEALQRAALSGEPPSLPDTPIDPERELTEWCRAHLAHFYLARSTIRICMAELEEHPDFVRCASARPSRASHDLQVYLQRLRDQGLAHADLDLSAASAMLLGTLFADAMGRDIMPEMYAYTSDEAPTQYVKLFLRGIGARSSRTRKRTQDETAARRAS